MNNPTINSTQTERAVVPQPERIQLLGLALDLIDLETAIHLIRAWLRNPQAAKTVITLNPEIIIQAETDTALTQAIQNANLVTADGIGIVWAVKHRLKRSVPGRATGVDLVTRLMELEGQNLRVYFLGAAPGVAQQAAKNSQTRYGIQIAGVQDGYFKSDQLGVIIQNIRASNADLLVTGLGAGRQEMLNHTHHPARVNIGVGGTLDVLAGAVERAPEWTSKLGIEWVWRITTMKRWGRAWRLVEFVLRVLGLKPGR